MKWNWQQSDWPKFTWKKQLLTKAEELFLLGAGSIVGITKYLSLSDKEQFTVEIMSTEAVTTSEIEGEILNRKSVQSSICRQLGLAADKNPIEPAEQGIAEMMVDLYRGFSTPLTHQTLSRWHRMLMKGRRDLKNIGSYRSYLEPMQVVSGALHSPKIHFEAPPSSHVPAEMKRFIEWFNRTGPTGRDPLPALTRSGIAHLYFVSIHPFEDGNGRLARAISEKILSQSLGAATLTVLATTILSKRNAYYDVLEEANKKNEMTRWLSWFSTTALEAQKRTAGHVEFMIEKMKFLDRLRGQLNERQEKAVMRLFREGPEGFAGGLSAKKYIAITKASAATTTRDLVGLVMKNALIKKGENRYARYYLNIPYVTNHLHRPHQN
ncbi:MAG: Fic family protein [Elusimicrobiota bacterium]